MCTVYINISSNMICNDNKIIYEEAFSKTRQAPLKKWVSNVNTKFRDRVLGKSSSYMCNYASIYIYMKRSFSKPNLQTWDWHLEPSFLMALKVFWKRALHISAIKKKRVPNVTPMCTYIYIYTLID